MADVADVVDVWTSAHRPAALQPRLLLDDNLYARKEQEARWEAWQALFAARKLPFKRRVWKIPECVCFPPHMLLTTPDLKIIAETVRKQGMGKISHWDKIDSSDVTNGLVVGSGQHSNYFHWMVEMAPKTAKWGAERGLSNIVIPNKLPTFAAQSLTYLMSTAPNALEVKRPVRLENAWFVENFAFSNVRISPLVTDFYAQLRPTKKPYRKLIISRRDAKTRRVLNEERFYEVAAKHGFELILSGKMPVKEQAALFSEASVVVGAHGANLTNMVFMQPGTQLIEIVPESFGAGMTCYAALAELLKIEYTCAIARAHQIPGQPQEAADIELGDGLIEEILSSIN